MKRGAASLNHFEMNPQIIFWALRKYIVWIILIALLFTVGAWVYTTQFITPLYRATLSMCVFAGERNGSTISGSELVSDARLANTYRLLLTSQPVMNAVSEQLGGSIDASELSGLVSATIVGESQFINVFVTSPEPQTCLAVADAISEVAPKVLRELARGGEMVSVNRATLPTAPVSPNLGLNMTNGFLLGLLLSCAAIILISALDTTLHREEDLERCFDIPVLGTVPSMTGSVTSSAKNNGKHSGRK